MFNLATNGNDASKIMLSIKEQLSNDAEISSSEWVKNNDELVRRFDYLIHLENNPDPVRFSLEIHCQLYQHKLIEKEVTTSNIYFVLAKDTAFEDEFQAAIFGVKGKALEGRVKDNETTGYFILKVEPVKNKESLFTLENTSGENFGNQNEAMLLTQNYTIGKRIYSLLETDEDLSFYIFNNEGDSPAIKLPISNDGKDISFAALEFNNQC